MLPRNHPDRIRIAFDDHRLAANAGLLLPSTLAHLTGQKQESSFDRHNSNGKLRYSWAVGLEGI